MSVIRWEDPPESHQATGREKRPRRHEHWKKVAEQLRERPGEWALLLEAQTFGNGGGIAGQIKVGRLAAFRPAGRYEATTRTVNGLYAVYARYVGPGSTSPEPGPEPLAEAPTLTEIVDFLDPDGTLRAEPTKGGTE